MKIKEFSAMTGLSTSSIRFYDKHGLFECNRSENGYRSFSPEDAFRSNAFRTLFKYGFSVDEAARIVNEEQGCEEFADSLRDRKAQMQREIDELQIRINHVDRALNHIEERAGLCAEVDECDFYCIRASHGRDFGVASDNRSAIAEIYEHLGLSFCSRIITKSDLESDAPTLDPSYVISIKDKDARLLSEETLASAEIVELGHCVYFRREATREESARRESYAPLYEYLDKHGLAIRGDAILFPLFLNLDGKGRDAEAIYVPVEKAAVR